MLTTTVRLPRDEDEEEREKADLQNSLHLVFRWAAARHSNGFLSLSLFSHWFTVLRRFGGENRKKNCCCQVSQSVKEEEKGKLSIRIVKLYFTCIELFSLFSFFVALSQLIGRQKKTIWSSIIDHLLTVISCGACRVPSDRRTDSYSRLQFKKKERKWRSSTIPF